ncbi:MAG: hypothetical protein JSS60_08675 [Verrucomicrobia bacterium]|nr:hypothetical protein [Verrucomicrobiota bacterium]
MNDQLQESDSGRLFFGAQVEAPWPKDYPPGRMIEEETRHVTLAFLGDTSLPALQALLPSAPLPPFLIGPAGIGNTLIFLPPDKNRVAALSVQWLDPSAAFNIYQKQFTIWLKASGYSLEERPYFPHITIARGPFDKKSWQDHFAPLPFFVKAIRLYQSIGNLHYRSLWDVPLLSPFEEFEHTADIAFLVRGSTPQELHRNAQLALAFKFPSLVPFFSARLQGTLDEIIIALNEIVGTADAECGCPFKAVSFHGQIKVDENNLLNWEMIVDV